MLPQPPPPRPEQRAAALGTALARYDDAQRRTRSSQAGNEGVGRWWSRLFAPQYAAIAAVAVVVLVSLPQLDTADRATIASLPTATSGSAARDEAARTVVANEAAPPLPETTATEMAPAPALQPLPRAATPPPDAEAVVDMPAPAAPSIVPQVQDRSEFAAAAPPPPPPPVPVMDAEAAPKPSLRLAESGAAAADDAAGQIVVTGQRRRASATPVTDAWSACTLEDPRQELARCRRLIDPGAKGSQGRADTLLADGLTLGWRGDWNGAVSKFDAAIALTPRSALAHLNRALARQRNGDVAGAAADHDLAVRYGRNDARTYFFRGRFKREQGDFGGASQDERRTNEVDARRASSY